MSQYWEKQSTVECSRYEILRFCPPWTLAMKIWKVGGQLKFFDCYENKAVKQTILLQKRKQFSCVNFLLNNQSKMMNRDCLWKSLHTKRYDLMLNTMLSNWKETLQNTLSFLIPSKAVSMTTQLNSFNYAWALLYCDLKRNPHRIVSHNRYDCCNWWCIVLFWK